MRIINDKVMRLVPTGTLTYAERDKERWGIFAAEREGDDTALMGYLVKYSPSDPHVLTYPGTRARPDHSPACTRL